MGVNCGPPIILLAFICLFESSSTVRITSLDVPRTAWNSVKLNCRYDLEGADLYAVKWYKDGEEFFRCFADGTVQEFPKSDIKIYHNENAHVGSCFFELTTLTAKSGGEYMCEVSLDWPTFKTVTKSSYLQIIEPSRVVQSLPTENGIDTESNSIDVMAASSDLPYYRSRYNYFYCVLITLCFKILLR